MNGLCDMVDCKRPAQKHGLTKEGPTRVRSPVVPDRLSVDGVEACIDHMHNPACDFRPWVAAVEREARRCRYCRDPECVRASCQRTQTYDEAWENWEGVRRSVAWDDWNDNGNTRIRTLLTSLEWSSQEGCRMWPVEDTMDAEMYCPCCCKRSEDGHAADCELQGILDLLREL